MENTQLALCGILFVPPKNENTPIDITIFHAVGVQKKSIVVIPATKDFPERRIKNAEIGEIISYGLDGGYKTWCLPEDRDDKIEAMKTLCKKFIRNKIDHWNRINFGLQLDPVVSEEQRS